MSGLRKAIIAAAVIVGSTAAAGAQSGPEKRENPCDISEASFPLTEENRLDDRRLLERFQEKTFTIQRRLKQDKKRSFERVMAFYFRGDGSLRMSCRHRKRPGGDLLPCEGFGPSATLSAGNATDVASWRVDRGRICWHRTKNDRELCFIIHEADGRGYARLDGARNVSCFEGDLSFK